MSFRKDPQLFPVVRGPGEGAVYDVLGHVTRCILTSEMTGGSYSLFEIETPPGASVPCHIHSREDETFVVLAGEVALTVGEMTHVLTVDSAAFGPRGIRHGFRNSGASPSRMLVLTTPGGFEGFFAECDERFGGGAAFDASVFEQVLSRHGMTSSA